MGLVNHLKNADAQRKVLAEASGLHMVTGHAFLSYTVGVHPSHVIYVRKILAHVEEGRWRGPKAVWYNGLTIPTADYHFLDGSQTQTSPFFNTDVPHFRSVVLDGKLPQGVGEADTSKETPSDLWALCECELFPDFDAAGNQIVPADYDGDGELEPGEICAKINQPLDEEYFSYTVNPARVCAGWMLKKKYRRSGINWAKWVAWRDFLGTLETVDYTNGNFVGFGLTGKYYQGTNFNTFLSERVDPSIDFSTSNGAPAYGVPVDDFSVRWEGKIQPRYTETYTFKIAHDNGARLWIYKDGAWVQLLNVWQDDGDGPWGTDTATPIALTAGQFYPIKIEWNEGGGPGEFRLFWTSASQTEEIVPSEVLYPLPKQMPLYEAHIAFSTPTEMDAMIEACLMVSNSIRQHVDGKWEFYCVEQPEYQDDENLFHVQEGAGQIIDDIISFRQSDLRRSQQPNVFEAKVRCTETRFLEEPVNPIRIEVPELIEAAGGRRIYKTIEFFDESKFLNMTQWQTRKVMQHIINRTALKDTVVEFAGSALTYQVIKYDLIKLTHSDGGFAAKKFQVIEAVDDSPEESAETREFTLQAW